jgi:hypothetical protein
MNNILTNIHNFIHDTAINVDIWIKANPKQASPKTVLELAMNECS